ncbi:MAG: trehalose-phosphatase [Methanocellales archaeon]|nr:trehalose-phosphatase [Methanocellales archaeon]
MTHLKERSRLGNKLILVSNREPYIHEKSRKGIMCKRAMGGLMSTLDPVMQSYGGTWVAWGSGDADFEVTDSQNRVQVPCENPRYMLKRVQLSEREINRYYYGFSNRALWPISHLFIEKAYFNPETLLLMDYDGTLTSIVDRPELAVLSDDMRDVLRKISKRYPIAIISGRSLADIKNLVEVKGICYAGNHGFEISGPGIELTKGEAERSKLTVQKVCSDMQKRLARIKGAIVENKGLTASVHYRLVSDADFQELERIFGEVTKPHLGEIKITRGKKVFEIRPNIDWDKGKAVLWIIDALKASAERAIYIGDNHTDEDAFLALKDKGITILVSEKLKTSNAKYFLRNVSEVKIFLEKLISCSNS